MQFSDIQFIEHGGRYGSSLGLNAGGYWVAKLRFEQMWQRANATIQELNWSEPQTVVTIYGDKEDWLSYKVGARIALGRCLKHFADHDMLPIRVANPNKKGTRKYVRA